MKGKDKCKSLKEIRKKIADENDIAYAVSECSHKGDCLGTCPKCESELRYLERELEKKRSAGLKVAVAGVAAGMVVSTASCVMPDNLGAGGNGPGTQSTESLTDTYELEGDMIAGEIPYIVETAIMGDMLPTGNEWEETKKSEPTMGLIDNSETIKYSTDENGETITENTTIVTVSEIRWSDTTDEFGNTMGPPLADEILNGADGE